MWSSSIQSTFCWKRGFHSRFLACKLSHVALGQLRDLQPPTSPRCTQAHRVSPHCRELFLSTKTQRQVKITASFYFPLFFERWLSLHYPESNLMQTAAASPPDSSYVPQSIAIIIIMLLLLVTALISNLHPVLLSGSLIIPNIEQIPRDACSPPRKGMLSQMFPRLNQTENVRLYFQPVILINKSL